MKTILVSGASGIVGYGALKSLRAAKGKYKLVGSTIYNDSVAPAFCDSLEIAPNTNAPTYLEWLYHIIHKHEIDLIIPGINDDMLLWNEHRDQILNCNANPMLNSPELIRLSADKLDFYKELLRSNSKYAIESHQHGTFTELRDRLGLPFLLKPRLGFASKGIVIVESEEIFNAHEKDFGTITIAQPIIGSQETEYTVSAFFDKTSNLCCWMSLRRKLSQQGYTEKAEVANPSNVETAITELAFQFKPVGPTNFQFRVHNGELKLLEINPRISSATSIRTSFGYNESLMAAEYFLENKKPIQPAIQKGYAVRYTEDYIFYDCSNI